VSYVPDWLLMKILRLETTLHSIGVTLLNLTIRYDQEKLQGRLRHLRQGKKL